MSDPIQDAIIKAQGTSQGAANQVVQKAGQFINKLEDLPVEEDFVLIKKQLEGEIFKRTSQANQLKVIANEASVENLKQTISSLLSVGVSSLKLPPLDKKSLQTAALDKLEKKLMGEKRDISKQTLQSAKELYKYPMVAVDSVKPTIEPLNIPELPVINI